MPQVIVEEEVEREASHKEAKVNNKLLLLYMCNILQQ